MNKSLVHLDRCIEVAGDDRLGRLLHRLWKWQFHTNIVRDERRWVAWTYAQWAKALNISYTQFKYMIEKPRARELLVREQHQRHGKNVLFIRFTDQCLVDLLLPNSEMGKSAQLGEGQNCPTLYKNPKKEPGDRTKVATASAVAVQDSDSIEKSFGNVVTFPGQGGPVSTVDEITKKFAEAKPKPIDTLKPDKVSSLIAVWQSDAAEKKITAPPFTDKEKGQLARLIKIWPADKAPAILKYVLREWGLFTYEAQSVASAFKCPENPTVGFLVKYQHVAVDVWKKRPLAKTKGAFVEPAPSVQSIAQPAKDKPATFAELLAIEEELKAAS